MPITWKKIDGKVIQTGTFQKGQKVREIGGGELYPPDDIDEKILSSDYEADEFEFDENGNPTKIITIKESPVLLARRERGAKKKKIKQILDKPGADAQELKEVIKLLVRNGA